LVLDLFSWAFRVGAGSSLPGLDTFLASLASQVPQHENAWGPGWRDGRPFDCPWGPMGMENLWTSPDFERIDHLNKYIYNYIYIYDDMMMLNIIM
jgi:hypothetical protein